MTLLSVHVHNIYHLYLIWWLYSLFMFIRYIISKYADDTTPFSCSWDISYVGTLMTLLSVHIHKTYHLQLRWWLNSLFMRERYIIVRYTDGTTPYLCAQDISSVATLMTLLLIPLRKIYHLYLRWWHYSLFMFIRYNTCSYADDTTPYSCPQEISSVATLMTLLPIHSHQINHM